MTRTPQAQGPGADLSETGEIVHEWLEPVGGAENVVEAMLEAFPEARLTAAWNDATQRFPLVRETLLARTPLRHSKAFSLPVMPLVWRHLGRSDADWILSSSHLFAHHARFSGAARHAIRFVYAYTPARYIWSPELDERGQNPLVRAASPILKRLDRARAQEADHIAAISGHVAERIATQWERKSTVIYPPVDARDIIDDLRSANSLDPDEERILESLPASFVLGASRFVPYKRLEDVIKAGAAAGLPVVLAGDGPHREALQDAARESRVPVTFVRSPSTPLLRRLLSRATVYVFPALEDFGIMPVEAMAAGTGVVSLDRGGASETVVDGLTGSTVRSFRHDDLGEAVTRAADVDADACRLRALEFDRVVFQDRLRTWVQSGLR